MYLFFFSSLSFPGFFFFYAVFRGDDGRVKIREHKRITTAGFAGGETAATTTTVQ